MTAERISWAVRPKGLMPGSFCVSVAGQPVIHIARDDKRAEAMRAALAVTAPEVAVLDFPAWDCLPYDRVSPNPDISARRMATLAVLVDGLAAPSCWSRR